MPMLRVMAICAVVASNSALAQTDSIARWPVDSGARVRVRAATLGPMFRRGTLTSATADSIVIQQPRVGRFAVGLDQITSLQVLRESHTEKAKYTMIGLLVGAAGGAILGAATYSPTKCDSSVTFCIDVFDRSSTAAMAAVLLGAVGGLVGLMAGASPKETWASVPIPAR